MKNNQTTLQLQNKRLVTILSFIALLLCVPLVAMQFTNEVNWSLLDFVAMGILLVGAGLTCELVLRKVSAKKYRMLFCGIALATFFLVWVELAVGIF